MTREEAKLIQHAATGKHRIADTDSMWDTVMEMKSRGIFVYVERGSVTYIMPTPDALADAQEVLK
jgi:hypothetical protein